MAKKEWQDRAFSIVFEDPHLIVVDKSAHVLTVATGRAERHTLASRVANYLRHTSRHREAWVAHRLDRGVSGLVVIAKSRLILQRLREAFTRHTPERRYIAIVAGVVSPSSGTFRSRLETAKNLDRFSTHQEGRGELAITHFQVQRALGDTSLVEARLETGRRNQIRVHFADAGHPVLGDPRYGGAAAVHPRWPAHRLALHALALALEHPVTGQWVEFTSELPPCMQHFVDGAC
jgi:23S rRNA pseudouridine1911/1915/1917 synthase